MKFLSAALFLLPFLAWGQSFEDVVNFDIELSSLDDPALVRDAVSSQQIAILEGLLGDAYIEETEEGVEVWVTLVGGSWIGTEDVRSYSCRVLFRGETWISAFPGKRPRDPAENYVPQGSRLLVACRFLGHDGETGVPMAEMVDYRVLY